MSYSPPAMGAHGNKFRLGFFCKLHDAIRLLKAISDIQRVVFQLVLNGKGFHQFLFISCALEVVRRVDEEEV